MFSTLSHPDTPAFPFDELVPYAPGGSDGAGCGSTASPTPGPRSDRRERPDPPRRGIPRGMERARHPAGGGSPRRGFRGRGCGKAGEVCRLRGGVRPHGRVPRNFPGHLLHPRGDRRRREPRRRRVDGSRNPQRREAHANPPTRREIRVRGVSILTVGDAGITHGLYVWDTAGLLRNIGLLPEL